MQSEADGHQGWRSQKTNQLLTVAVVLLALLVVRPADFGAGSAEAAAPARSSTPFNSGAQREKIVSALRAVEQRLDRIERKLNAGLEVRVTEMPQVKIAE